RATRSFFLGGAHGSGGKATPSLHYFTPHFPTNPHLPFAPHFPCKFAVRGQSLWGNAESLFSPRRFAIQRDASGKFLGFGNADMPKLVEMKGRFAQLMPPKIPSKKTRRWRSNSCK